MQQQGPQQWKKWASVGIILWAVGLQAHMMYLKSTPEFKAKFPEIAAAADNSEDEDNSFSIRFKPPSSNSNSST